MSLLIHLSLKIWAITLSNFAFLVVINSPVIFLEMDGDYQWEKTMSK